MQNAALSNNSNPVCLLHENTAPESCDFCFEFLHHIESARAPSPVDTSYLSMLTPVDVQVNMADFDFNQFDDQTLRSPIIGTNPMISGFDMTHAPIAGCGDAMTIAPNGIHSFDMAPSVGLEEQLFGSLTPVVSNGEASASAEKSEGRVVGVEAASRKTSNRSRSELVPVPIELRIKKKGVMEDDNTRITRGALAGRQPVPVPKELRYDGEDDNTRVPLSNLKQRKLIPVDEKLLLPGESKGLMLTRGAIIKRTNRLNRQAANMSL